MKSCCDKNQLFFNSLLMKLPSLEEYEQRAAEKVEATA